MSNKKLNPRKVPRTQADVEKAYRRGEVDGTRAAMTILLYVLKDKFNASDEDVMELSNAFRSTTESVAKGYVSEADLRRVVRDEYDWSFEIK